ncbi:hypothetical protein P8452_14116 [Trifolium repens]|nr:hypothetical protein P8452_14116 [Trifolium repens]
MNRGEVREAIHAKLVGITKWTMCSKLVSFFNPSNFIVNGIVITFISQSKTIFVCGGDQDAYIPLIGTDSLLHGLAKDTGLDSVSYRSRFDGPKDLIMFLSLDFKGPGPGCSSIGQGAFSEHGPFQPTRKGGLVLNRYNWYRVANMLYLESTIGVGFSYSTNTSNYFMVTDEWISRDAIVFLQGCFTRFQKYKNNNVFITQVSYGGHWAPQIAELILQTKPSFNLKGKLLVYYLI